LFFIYSLLTGNNINNTIRNAQFLIEFFSIFNHVFKYFPWFIIMWRCNTKLFNLNISKTNLHEKTNQLLKPFQIDEHEKYHVYLDHGNQLLVENKLKYHHNELVIVQLQAIHLYKYQIFTRNHMKKNTNRWKAAIACSDVAIKYFSSSLDSSGLSFLHTT